MKTNWLMLAWLAFPVIAAAQDTVYRERIYIGTGEYNPTQNWHALLRFDHAEGYNSGLSGSVQYVPDGTIPIQQCYDDTVFLNFEHGFYLDETHDRMYVTTLFTNNGNVLTTDPNVAKGSVAIFDNIHTLNGPQVPMRHLFGPSTTLRQPHGCWLDESRDILYVANTFANTILAFHNASTLDGDTPPTRTIQYPSLGAPVYVFIDETANRLFATCMPNGGGQPQVVIYNQASTINGNLQPIVTITGSNTRLGFRNPTVHNVWYNRHNGLMAVGHHTHELLMFDLNSINLNPSMPATHNLTPRVVQINELASDLDTINHNLYGLFWDEDRDIMYISDGYSGGTVGMAGGPQLGSPPNMIKIYENISDTSVHGIVTPARTICWTNGSTYYPPQPIWVTTEIGFSGMDEVTDDNPILLYPNPASTEVTLELPFVSGFTLALYDIAGRCRLLLPVTTSRMTLPLGGLAPGIYALYLVGETRSYSRKLIVR